MQGGKQGAAKTVAVEEGLEPVRRALEREGYRVIDLAGGHWSEADAIVVSGSRKDMLGDQSAETKAPVIDASGRTPEEILGELVRTIP
ncbi:MAG: YkuS family protein [Bacillota bacterium]